MSQAKGSPRVQSAARGKRPTPPKRPEETSSRAGRGVPIWVPAVLAVGLVAVLVLALTGVLGPSGDPIEQRTAELRAQEAERDRDQIETLTAQAREVRDQIVAPLEEFNESVPPGDGEQAASADADPERIQSWNETMADAATTFDESPSGSTGTNVARNSLAVSLGLMESAVGLYGVAAELDGDQQQELLARAGEQRDLAVRTWSVAATQLDAINVDAGFGHQHVYLEVEGTGALTPDGAEDGAEATIDGDHTEDDAVDDQQG